MLESLKNVNLKTAEVHRMRVTLQEFYEQANLQAAKAAPKILHEEGFRPIPALG